MEQQRHGRAVSEVWQPCLARCTLVDREGSATGRCRSKGYGLLHASASSPPTVRTALVRLQTTRVVQRTVSLIGTGTLQLTVLRSRVTRFPRRWHCPNAERFQECLTACADVSRAAPCTRGGNHVLRPGPSHMAPLRLAPRRPHNSSRRRGHELLRRRGARPLSSAATSLRSSPTVDAGVSGVPASCSATAATAERSEAAEPGLRNDGQMIVRAHLH